MSDTQRRGENRKGFWRIRATEGVGRPIWPCSTPRPVPYMPPGEVLRPFEFVCKTCVYYCLSNMHRFVLQVGTPETDDDGDHDAPTPSSIRSSRSTGSNTPPGSWGDGDGDVSGGFENSLPPPNYSPVVAGASAPASRAGKPGMVSPSDGRTRSSDLRASSTRLLGEVASAKMPGTSRMSGSPVMAAALSSSSRLRRAGGATSGSDARPRSMSDSPARESDGTIGGLNGIVGTKHGAVRAKSRRFGGSPQGQEGKTYRGRALEARSSSEGVSSRLVHVKSCVDTPDGCLHISWREGFFVRRSTRSRLGQRGLDASRQTPRFGRRFLTSEEWVWCAWPMDASQAGVSMRWIENLVRKSLLS